MTDNGGYAQTSLSMSDAGRQRKGSPSRDLFKQLHKANLPAYMFACDVDLRLVERSELAEMEPEDDDAAHCHTGRTGKGTGDA